MKKLVMLGLCLALLLPAAFAETDVAATSGVPTAALESSGPVTGDFDKPALTNPEARYTDIYMEETDGSETALFYILDGMNDEASDIETYGALYITENMPLDENGEPLVQARISIQDSPYGRLMIVSTEFEGVSSAVYYCGAYACMIQDGVFSEIEGHSQAEHDFYCESYHFPYGSLETLNGVRQDENGYTYWLIRSDDQLSFEFVTGDAMRILQLRIYFRGEDGALTLVSYADYDVGPALEVPGQVLDSFAAVLEPTPAPAIEPEDEDEPTDSAGDGEATIEDIINKFIEEETKA